jgi:hypothetical protein
VTIYNPKTTPLRPARVITVSGPADRALSTIVSVFTVRSFRVTTPAGAVLVKLELGHWWAPLLIWSTRWSTSIAGPAKHGIVGARIQTQPDATVAVTVSVLTSWSSRIFTPIFLAALDDAVAAFRDAGVLVDAGPVINAKTLR